MRKLKLQVQISVDGYIAGPNGEMDWMEWNWDDALKKYVGELGSKQDPMLIKATAFHYGIVVLHYEPKRH